ncbi:hypothetical protein BGZ96_012681 [Linnemannia gamsii]|uniref:Uncharacterized protein n=1 Tax=Linnemannia gamsii TaxID=64522 RepID=A0ABQ7JPW6_9FUNG|nr:hypothetical protein BGZ96_012681 [Linnemannia gamsii]
METQQLYPLFSRLEELDLRGDVCFKPPSMPSLFQFQEVPTAVLSSIQAEQELHPWRIKQLTVQCLNIHILEKCLVLEHLVVKDPVMARDWTGNASDPRLQILTQLQSMPNLKTIEIGRWTKWGVKDKFSRVSHDESETLGGDNGGGSGALWKRMVVKTKTKWAAAKTVVTATTLIDPQGVDWTLSRIQFSHATFPIQPSSHFAASFDTKGEKIRGTKIMSYPA